MKQPSHAFTTFFNRDNFNTPMNDLSFPERLAFFGIGKKEIEAVNSYNNPAIKQQLCQHPFSSVVNGSEYSHCEICGKTLKKKS